MTPHQPPRPEASPSATATAGMRPENKTLLAVALVLIALLTGLHGFTDWQHQHLSHLVLFLTIALVVLGLATVLRRETWRRFSADRARADSDERLQQALKASNEGLWDYDLAHERMYLSQDWRHLLGSATTTRGSSAATIVVNRAFWRQHIHPDDFRRVRSAFLEHLAGTTKRFEAEFRVGDGDGDWQWIQSRGGVIHQNQRGRPTRALGIVSDVTERRRATDILRRVTEGTAAATGADFHQHLVRCLATTLKMRCAYVASLASPGAEHADVLAMWLDQGFIPTFSYPLLDTPCSDVIGKRTCVHHAGVSRRYSNDKMLSRMGAEAFLGVPLFDSHGTPLGLLAVIDDKPLTDTQTATSVLSIFATRVSAEMERQRAEAELFRQKERAQVTLHSIGDAVITTNEHGQVEYLNPVAENLTGWPLEQARGIRLQRVFRVIDQDTQQPLPDLVQRCIEGQSGNDDEDQDGLSGNNRSVLVSRAGKHYAIQASAAPIRGSDNTVSGVVLVFTDVSEARRMASEMAYHASHDPLTGLVNRREIERRLETALDGVRNKGLHHALCYIDLDQFKVVNDSAGHKAGDELLRQVSTLLQTHIRRRDTLARVGGDEFALLLENCPLDTAERIAEALIASVRDLRFVWQDHSFRIGASIGLITIDADSGTVEELLARADAACYTAKDRGRNRVYFSHTDATPSNQRHAEIQRTTRITQAMEHNRFQLYAQPIVALHDADERRRFEILLRLEAEDGGLIEPGGFLPAAKRFGYMPLIDRWVIKHLCEAFHAPIQRNPRLELSINLSMASLNDPGLPQFISETAAASGLPLSNICFEFSERAAIATLDRTTGFIHKMKQAGCHLALDDFSGGLASFAFLRSQPIDYLKLDGSFIAKLASDPVDHALVSSVNRVAHLLDIQTIAEQAENADLVTALTDAGIDFAQGYALGAPLPLTQALAAASEPPT